MQIFVATVTCRNKKFLKWHTIGDTCANCCFLKHAKYFMTSKDNYCDSMNKNNDFKCDNTFYTEIPLKTILKNL